MPDCFGAWVVGRQLTMNFFSHETEYRQQSRQSVGIQEAPNPVILFTSRHFGGVSKADADEELNPAKYPAILAGLACPLPGHFPGHFVRRQKRPTE